MLRRGRRKSPLKRPNDPKWHARITTQHKTQENTPRASGDGGQPLFAFLSADKFSSRRSKIVAIDFYTQYVNDHLQSDTTTAGAFRITCSQLPDLSFRVRATRMEHEGSS